MLVFMDKQVTGGPVTYVTPLTKRNTGHTNVIVYSEKSTSQFLEVR